MRINVAQEVLDFPPTNNTFWLEATVEVPEESSIEGEVTNEQS